MKRLVFFLGGRRGGGPSQRKTFAIFQPSTEQYSYLGVLTTFDVDSGSCLHVILNTFIQRRYDVTVLLTQYAFRFNRIPQLAVTNYHPIQTRYLAFESKSLTNV